MNKTFAFAAVLLSACAADSEISVGPERGADVGVGSAQVTGRVNGTGRVVLGNDGFVRAVEVVDGRFAFHGVPDGTYFVKLEAAGVAAPPQTVTVDGADATVDLTSAPLAPSFSYHWQRDLSRGGLEQGSLVGSARALLRSSYGIELSDEELVWSDEHAARLLHTLRAVPQPMSSGWAPVTLPPTTWILSNGAFSHDDVVRVPVAAFASSRYVAPELHAAIVSDVTARGSDHAAVARILEERYGVQADSFSDGELTELIGHLEDMPSRLRSIPTLTRIHRRAEGTVTATVSSGTLEIGDDAFRGDMQYYLVREKARFVVSPQMQIAFGDLDMATAIANGVLLGTTTVGGYELEAPPIKRVAISAIGRNVTVEIGLEATSGLLYLFNDAAPGYQLVSLDAAGAAIHGSATLPAAGSWHPDVIVVRDSQGRMTVRDVSEVGWQLAVP